MFPTEKFNPGNPELEKIENQSSARARERGGTGDLMVVTGEREGWGQHIVPARYGCTTACSTLELFAGTQCNGNPMRVENENGRCQPDKKEPQSLWVLEYWCGFPEAQWGNINNRKTSPRYLHTHHVPEMSCINLPWIYLSSSSDVIYDIPSPLRTLETHSVIW